MRIKRKHIVPVTLTALTFAGLVSVGTGAVFGASANANATSFVSGTVNLTAAETNTTLNMPNMAPGDVSAGTITVTNTGTLAQRYAITSTTSESSLASNMLLAIRSGVRDCDVAHFTSEGTSLYSGTLGNTTGLNVVGNPAQGPQAGDRTLAPQTNETLCMEVSLPVATGNAYQGKQTVDTLTFNAEQVTNNGQDTTQGNNQ